MLKIILILIHASTIVLGKYRPLEEFAKSDDFDSYGYGYKATYLANFDDVASRGLVNFADLGHYGAADYTGFAVAKASELSKILGVIPKSMPNIVYYGGVTGLLSSKYEAKISVSCPPGLCNPDTLEYFKPRSFWFGCLTLSSKPGSCTITVTSYQWSEPAETQVFRFESPLTALSSNMTKAVFRDNFTWGTSLVFTTAVEPVDLLGVTVLDDLVYDWRSMWLPQ